MTTDTKAVTRWDVEALDERTSSEGRWVLFTDHERVVGKLEGERDALIDVVNRQAIAQLGLTSAFNKIEAALAESRAEVERLLEVIAPFAHFALVRSALGSTAPKGGTVYSVCTTLGDAEISAEDFEAAFNAIARNTNAAMEKGNV